MQHARIDARSRGDWENYLLMFGSHERLDALLGVADEIGRADEYWRCVVDTWTGDDAPGLNEAEWRRLFVDFYGHPEMMMNAAEREALAALPDPVPVFRGFTRDGGERGFAWTLDRGRAEWFARNYHGCGRMRLLYGTQVAGGTPRLAIGTVPADDVIAHLLERSEAEIVALPEDVSIKRIEPFPPPRDVT